jgi:hypothetical protein
VKAGQSGSGHKHITFRDTCAPKNLQTAVLVGSSSPVPVTNHQQVYDHMVFPIVEKLKGTQTNSVSNQSQIREEVEDPGCYHEPGDNSHLLDIVMEVGMETGLQKTLLPHHSSPVEQCLFLESKPPSQVRTVVTRPVGKVLLASMLTAQPRQLNGPRGTCA